MRLRRPATADTVRREAHRAFRVRPSRAPALPGALDRGDRLVRRGVRGSLRRRIVRTRACCSSCRGGADLPRRRASVSHDDVRRLDVDRARLPRRPDRPDRGPALVVALRRRGRHRPAEQVDRPLPRWRARSRPRSDRATAGAPARSCGRAPPSRWLSGCRTSLGQAEHDWPFLEMASALHDEGVQDANSFLFVPLQFLYMGPIAAPIWIAGLRGFFRDLEVRSYRFLGWAFLILAVGFIAISAKPYFLAPLYVPLLGAGAVARFRRGGHQAVRRAGLPAPEASSSAARGFAAPPMTDRPTPPTCCLLVRASSPKEIRWPRPRPPPCRRPTSLGSTDG